MYRYRDSHGGSGHEERAGDHHRELRWHLNHGQYTSILVPPQMALTSFLPLTILADDLTGACDTGTLFAGRGAVPVTVWPAPAVAAPVAVLDTETRALPAAEAAARVRSIVAAAPGARYFKKIDSTLRGRIGAEVAALLDATGARSAIICPALPSEGRAVVDRVLFVGGLPVAETPVASDPEFPAGRSSNVVDLLRPDIDRPLAWIPLDQVRAGVASLSARMREAHGHGGGGRRRA